MKQQVQVTRTLIPAPTVEKPDRQVYQIAYQQGTLPPHFVYIEKDDWTKEKEVKAIQADIKKRSEVKTETLEV